MNIDGRNTLACTSFIDNNIQRDTTILPLTYFQVMKDLVVDMTNFYTQYKMIQPVLMRKTPKVITIIFRQKVKKSIIKVRKIEPSLTVYMNVYYVLVASLIAHLIGGSLVIIMDLLFYWLLIDGL
jgi:hypothetical protein